MRNWEITYSKYIPGRPAIDYIDVHGEIFFKKKRVWKNKH